MERNDCDRKEKDRVKNTKSETEARKKKKGKHSSKSSTLDLSKIVVDDEITKNLIRKIRKLKKKKKKDEKKKHIKFGDKAHSNKLGSVISKESRYFAPMTKEEWEKQADTLKRVYDEDTGRTRLMKGTGEIVEECVSRSRQLSINRMATMKDGEYFQKMLSNLK